MEGATYAGKLAASSISGHTIFLNTMHSRLQCASACDDDSMSETSLARGPEDDTPTREPPSERDPDTGLPIGPVVQSTALRLRKNACETVAGEGAGKVNTSEVRYRDPRCGHG